MPTASNVDLKTGRLCHWNLVRLEVKSQPSQPGLLAYSSGSLASCLKVSLPIPDRLRLLKLCQAHYSPHPSNMSYMTPHTLRLQLPLLC